MKKIIIAAFVAIIHLSALAQQPKKFIIDGKIIADTLTTGKIYLQYLDDDIVMQDSSVIDHNTYHLEGKMHDGAIVANLFWYKTVNGVKARKNPFKGFLKFYTVPGQVNLVHEGRFEKAKISGSPVENDASMVQQQVRERKRTEFDIEADYIKTHPDSWLSYVFLAPIVKSKKTSLDTAGQLYASLGSELKKYRQVRALNELIIAGRTIAIGKPSIDFTQKDLNGKPVSLSSFRGKYVFIDFWASWCHPCREENPFVAKAYQKFKTKGFEVLGVSLDGNREAWIKAMKEDNVEWKQVSNLMGFKDEVVSKYGITSIPRNFLIDPSGIIIAMDLRGPMLEEELSKILK